jgi:predicted N-acetyltransferase YhbS
MLFEITTERPEDRAHIEILLDAAFGSERHHKTSYRFRDGVAPDSHLQLVARAGKQIVGSVRCWPVAIGDQAVPALLLGPLVVAERFRNAGIGAALVQRTLEMAAWGRHRIMLLVGDFTYYARFGFMPAAPLGLYMPGERIERLLVAELDKGALSGVVGDIQPWRSLRRRAGDAQRPGSARRRVMGDERRSGEDGERRGNQHGAGRTGDVDTVALGEDERVRA